MHSIDHALTEVLSVIAIVGGSGALLRRPIRQWRTRRKNHDLAIDGFVQMRIDISKMLEEFKPNGGGSLRDLLDKMRQELVEAKDATMRNGVVVLAILDLDPRPMYIVDEKVEVTWVNHSYSQLVQRDYKDLMGKGYHAIFVPEERYKVATEINKLFSVNAESIFNFTIRVNDKAGTLIPVTSHTYPIRNTEGKRMGSIGYLDIR